MTSAGSAAATSCPSRVGVVRVSGYGTVPPHAVDDGRVITGEPTTVAAALAVEAATLMPLPGEPFDCARLLSARVDAKPRVLVRQCTYPVPARYAGRRLSVRLGASAVEVRDGPITVARHERAVGKFHDVLTLDHYLEVPRPWDSSRPGITWTPVNPLFCSATPTLENRTC